MQSDEWNKKEMNRKLFARSNLPSYYNEGLHATTKSYFEHEKAQERQSSL